MITSEVRTITPAEAAKLLEANKNNRNIRVGRVATYARDMKAKQWRVNGSALLFNGSGKLYDGQHRLLACVQANTPFTTLVVEGLSDSDHATIDVGAARTMADQLRWEGEPYANELAAVLRLVWRYDNGNWTNAEPSRNDLLRLLKKHPDIRNSLRCLRAAGNLQIQKSPFLGAIAVMEREHGEEITNQFLAELTNGTGYVDGDPCLALRNFATNVSASRNIRPSAQEWFAITLKGINAWLLGRTIRSLRWRRSGPQKEAFPQLVSREDAEA